MQKNRLFSKPLNSALDLKEENMTKMKTMEKLSSSHFVKFMSEFMAESDRAAVILGAAKLDLLLYQLLSKFLVASPSSKDELLDGDSPLGLRDRHIILFFILFNFNIQPIQID